MAPVSRRTALAAAFAGVASTPLLASAVTRTAPGADAAQSVALTAAEAPSPTSMLVTRQSLNRAMYFRTGLGGPLSLKRLGSGTPATYEVSDAMGPLAMLTEGARTVTVTGMERTFSEQKKQFKDTFDRATNGWGSSPGGGRWKVPTDGAVEFDIEGGLGAAVLHRSARSRFATLMDDDVADVDVSAAFTIDRMPEGDAISVGLTCAYDDADNNYRARISFLTTGEVKLTLEKEVQGTTTPLDSGQLGVGSDFTPLDLWHLRLQREGGTLRCRAWRDGTSQPTTWQRTAVDHSLTTGQIGIRVLANGGSTALPTRVLVHYFQADGRWGNAPEVTHDQWVRLLEAPFDGTLTADLEQRLRGWGADTSPDALAFAAMFLPGAETITDPARGLPVLGESGYGPFDLVSGNGTRLEGSDFWGYMGLTAWSFPNGETATNPDNAAPDPAVHRTRHLDCSGYVRMVYGHHMGLPMVNFRDYDGLNLPRTSAAQAGRGPGVVVAGPSHVPVEGGQVQAPPALDGLRPGDLVFFDADKDARKPDSVDHVGIYLGRDQYGNRRFASSRKTPNGPTMADLGARSVLDAKGQLYSDGLRVIRRF
ncbi:C40 family peptidase [Streptomyces sp. NPDC006879]|uniref:C40 family peptidase n=1 Tax=Streptomyces sp. NPDC006879 TaxID=3364767 RepID=UPI00368524A4